MKTGLMEAIISLLLYVGDASPFQGCQNLDEGFVGFLEGEPFSQGFDEGVIMFDLQAVLELDSVIRGNNYALTLFRVVIPSVPCENKLPVLNLCHDAVAVTVEIGGLRNVVLPNDLDLRRSLLLDV